MVDIPVVLVGGIQTNTNATLWKTNMAKELTYNQMGYFPCQQWLALLKPCKTPTTHT